MGDLHRDSPAIQQINDEFRHIEAKYQLHSFVETRPTNFGGLKSKIIVEKTSAIMGYPNERIAYLDADHRGVCKFDSPSDPNFVAVKNALVETLDKIKEKCTCPKSSCRHFTHTCRGHIESGAAKKPETPTEKLSVYLRPARR